MEIIGYIFLLQVVICLGLFLYKLYNVLRAGEAVSISASVLMLISYLLVWGVGLLAVLFDLGVNRIFYALFTLESWLLPIYAIFFFIELLLYYKIAIAGGTKGYRPQERF